MYFLFFYFFSFLFLYTFLNKSVRTGIFLFFIFYTKRKFCLYVYSLHKVNYLMPYLITTSKLATAVSNHAIGFFSETSDKFVVLSRGNVLSLFKVSSNSSLEGVLVHVQDFRFFCSLKCVHSIAILDPNNKGAQRHILFLFSARQEISLLTFAQDLENDGRYTINTLYCGVLPDGFQKPLQHLRTVSCSTDSSPTPVMIPFIVIAVGAWDLHVIDIFAAIGSQLACKSFTGEKEINHSLFSPGVMASIEERSRFPPYILFPFHVSEYEVKDMTFGSISVDERFISLYILSADRSDCMQISEYCFSLTEKLPKNTNHCPSASSFPLIKYDLVARKRCLQNNVDPTASRILSSLNGVMCVGSQLVTFIPLQNQGSSLTIELPFDGNLTSEDISATLLPRLDRNDSVLCTIGEKCVVTVFEHKGVLSQAYVLMSTNNVGTIPSSILALNSNTCLLCSQLQDSIVVELESWAKRTIIENCGPVLDIAVGSGDSSLVLASTGAGMHGGVTILRSIFSLTAEKRVSFLQNSVSRVIAAGEIMILETFKGIVVQFFHPNHSVHEVFLVNLSIPMLSCGDLINVYCCGNEYIFVFEGIAVLFSWSDNSKCVLKASAEFFPAEKSEGLFMFSSFHGKELTVACSHRLYYFPCLLECGWSTPSSTPIAAIVLHSGICVVGKWDSSVSLLDLSTQSIVGELQLEAVPHSICCMSLAKSSSPAILIGLTNGYLCMTTPDLLLEGRFQQHFLLANHPLDLLALDERIAISFGPVPLLLLGSREGFFIKGLNVDDASSGGTLSSGSSTKYTFFSKTRSTLYIGELEKTENKMNGTFLPFGGTVTIVRIIRNWDGFVIALRKNNRDSILFLSNTCIRKKCVEPLGEQRWELLESEQCVFLESISLEFPEEIDEKTVLLAGTSFLFREVSTARSSRMMWFPRGTNGQLIPKGEIDIKGPLYSCCVVPNSSGTVVLAVSSVIVLYKWSVWETTFIKYEVLDAGLMMFRLLPIVPTITSSASSGGSSTVVAIDFRFGAIYLDINPRGVVSVLSKEASIREATAGVVLADEETLIADQNDNILFLQRVKEKDKISPSVGKPVDYVSQTGGVKVLGQFYIGQCINCLERGSCAPVEYMTEKNVHFSAPKSNQVIFGTAQGAFGTITPLSFSSYFVLRALEHGVMVMDAPEGSFLPLSFRKACLSHELQGGAQRCDQNDSLFHRENSLSRRRVVDGDVIKSFLLHSKRKRNDVLRVATQVAMWWWPVFHIIEQDGEGTSDFLPPPLRSSLDKNSESIQEKCNEVLFKAHLPLLPFTEDKVLPFIFFIQQLN